MYLLERMSFYKHGINIIQIGNNVWIGDNAVILSGVKIGDGAIVGANVVVTKDVENYTVVARVPARKIKE